MTNRKFRTVASPNSQTQTDAARKRMRQMLLETLENRQLMAVGPQLIGVQPNNSDLLLDGSVRTVAPRELTFRFDDAQVIDAATLSGIRITRAGSDGSFGQFSASTDFGSSGAVNVQLTARAQATAVSVTFTTADLGPSGLPQFSATGNSLSVTLNSNLSAPTTANGLVSALNASPIASPLVIAKVNGGLASTIIGTLNPANYSPVQLTQSNDAIVAPGAMLVGASPNENEVTIRFADALTDDNYRIEIFGFDDPVRGIVGLRNTSGDLFAPNASGTRQNSIDFRLDLGAQITAVVPQPVIRTANGLQQQRDTVVVYFDSDKLLVENDGFGAPTARSAENPAFYKLILTRDSVRNTDDTFFTPSSVKYNATTNTATLKFATDINSLAGNAPATFRLRVGTRESAPIVPTYSEAAATVISDLNTGGSAKVRFTSRQVGEAGSGVQVEVINSNSNTPVVTTVGRVVKVDMGRQNLTASEFVTLVNNSSAATALLSVSLEAGSNGNAVVGNRNLAYSPLTLVGLGSSFDTATNIGTIGSAATQQTSLVLGSSIDPESFMLDLLGASDDPGHRVLPQNQAGAFENHVNSRFGADKVNGITTIFYNFKTVYSTDLSGTSLVNAISEIQKTRAREAMGLWAKYLGIQFVETSDLGITIATGSSDGLLAVGGTQIQDEFSRSFGVRIDPTFTNSLVILSATNTWNDNYGESYFRAMAAALGMVLGLEHAGDLPPTTLMRLDTEFLAGSGVLINANDAQLNASDEKYEPIFPGNQDILHGQYIYRPDGSDVDLYRFDVDFGGADRVGLFTAETYAERLTNSSALNTNIELFRATQATAATNFGAGDTLQVRFESLLPGTRGNHFQIRFTQSARGAGAQPGITVQANSVSIDLNTTAGSESTVSDVLNQLAASSAAAKLVKASLVRGALNTRIGANVLTQNPVVLSGGKMELVAQNDDYFSRDSLIKQSLTAGVYYIGVSASGNDDYDATVEGTGFGGKSQGDYQLRISFRAQVDTSDTIQDISGSNDPAVSLDGDGDGAPGGNYDFWFQTRPLDRVVSFNAGATAALEGRVITVIGANGVQRDFEFDSNSSVAPGRIGISYTAGDAAGTLANSLAAAIVARSELGVSAIANGARLTLRGERLIRIDPALVLIDVAGKTIFVDKAAGPNADGSLARPFNNISSSGVANAFGAAMPGDIVRIVGNGGVDGNMATTNDNFAYEIGTGLLPNSILSDGSTMEVPRGVTTMIDAGAIFKLYRARIGVGSSNLNIDRSDSALQVLGTPLLLDASGNAVKSNGSNVSGNVIFTSWLDESVGLDTYTPRTTPTAGDWGGISYRRDVDNSAGRTDLEDEGIFLQYVNQANIRYAGGTVIVDSIQQSVNPIEMLETRPTITFNTITFAANAAMSALPNSFEETNFNEPRFQVNGAFTSDYDRVGPDIRSNRLLNNSLNGLFIRVDTPADGVTRTLTVPGRFDDIDIVHVITENLIVSGSTGGALLDSTVPPADLISTAPGVGGTLTPGNYNYKITFLDRNGYESIPSNASALQLINPGETAIQIAGLPSATGEFVARRLYRSNSQGQGPYELVATLDRQSSTYLDIGKVLGGTLTRDRADVSGVVLSRTNGGTVAVGLYNYRVVMVDAAGREGLASNVTASFNLTTAGSISLQNLPLTLNGYVTRRIYRSFNGQPFERLADLPDSTSAGETQFIDTGAKLGGSLSVEAFAVKRPRATASLVIDPGAVIKLEAARIEATFGANIIAEGTDGLPIHFTSKLDDMVGAGGTFDTNNNQGSNSPAPRDWGGIYMAPTSTLSVDHARFSYGGGVTKLDGTFRAFNTIEIQQAEARIANSIFENNANGFGGQGPGARFGRLSNAQSTIFVRGAQPTIINNIFRNNAGSAIEIDANSMTDTIMGDPGRQTGAADRSDSFDSNRGPLIRNNRLVNNGLNGLEIRGDTLTTASVWDDTDIVHVLFDGIFIDNVQHEGGLTLRSAANESLVVKFEGYGSNFNDNLGAGITAAGQLTSGPNRVGGALYVIGQPGFPVILTSLRDDSVGAGLEPDGSPQTDTNNDGIETIPQSADWRGIFLDQDSNDRNVAPVLETESPTAAAPGPNSSALTAQVLGDLASKPSASSESLRLGFIVEGVLGQREDIDVYSFTAEAGSEIWLDVDYTRHYSDLVLELLDANGSLLARSDDSTAETIDPNLLVTTSLISASNVNRLPVRVNGVRTTSANLVKEDGTTNPSDPGMRVLLPGAIGSRSTFYFRVRSASADINAVDSGLTKGSYQVQVRLREQQEFAGSTINFADIRYAMNGVHLRGLPGTSPLVGEVQEDESVGTGDQTANNGTAVGRTQTGSRPQYIGDILQTAKGAISVGGTLSSLDDVDFYRMSVTQADLVDSLNNAFAPVVFDMDYADGMNRPDTSINIFREEFSTRGRQYRLIFSGDSSNIADDQRRPLTVTDIEDLSRGSLGNKDAYIGPVALPEGNYLIGISTNAYQPRTKILNVSNNIFQVKPINSIRRIVDQNFATATTTFDPPQVQNFLPKTTFTNETVTSALFSLAGYTAADKPALYLDYANTGAFSVSVLEPSGTVTHIATSQGFNPTLVSGTGRSRKVELDRFAGLSDLRLVFNHPGALGATTPGIQTISNIVIGFAERGEQIGVANEPVILDPIPALAQSLVRSSQPFSLETYTAADRPALTFPYRVTAGSLTVSVNGIQLGTTDANILQPGSTLLTFNSPQQVTASLNLSQFAGQRNLVVTFSTSTTAATTGNVGEVIIVLGDGSRVFSGEPNPTYAFDPSTTTFPPPGAYQFEVRLAESFFRSNQTAAPTLTKSWDTNDRLSEQISLNIPAGNTLTDGDQFELSDGGTRIVFEFSTDASVGLGNVPIRFLATDAAFVIAQKVRDAINNPNVQSRLNIRAATSGGNDTSTAGQDTRLHLFGNASYRTVRVTNASAEIKVQAHQGASDKNVTRDQGQVIIQNSFIRESRDYGIWSEPARRLADDRDNLTFAEFGIMQELPKIAGTQAVRNLLNTNDSVAGGLVPGIVVQNNVLEEGGLGGVKIQGENPIWMISAATVPTTDNNPNVNDNGTHFGFFIDDRDVLIVDSDRTRLQFEFEDLAGGATGGPVFGSGQVEGDGYSLNSSVAYYRDQGGVFYQRQTGGTLQPFATTALESMMMLRDSILGSMLVTNGTTQVARATVAKSLLGPAANAPALTSSGYPNYYNRPALYLEGPTNLQTSVSGFDIRALDLGQAPQPQARVVNNTIIGTDGRASLDGARPPAESNDTIQTATETWQGTAHNPLSYTANAAIGDNLTLSRNLSQDIDMYQFKLGVGERVIVDIDTPTSSTLNSVVQIFDSRGILQQFTNRVGQLVTSSDNDAAPGETLSLDSYVDFTSTSPGVYYAVVSSVGNVAYDPLSLANRQNGTTVGSYSINLSVRHPQQFTITAEDASAYLPGDTFTIAGVPDITGTQSPERTFEFTFGGGVGAGNIPIRLGADWRFPDVARAIAKAINEGGVGGAPAISNVQNLPNGAFGTANPLPPVRARALGGLAGVLDAPLNNITGDLATVLDLFSAVDERGTNVVSNRELERLIGGPFTEVNQGLELFTRRVDGIIRARGNPFNGVTYFTSLSHLGLGHDRDSTQPLSRTSVGDGTTEKFVVVSNAAWVRSNNSIIVDPDANAGTNLDQFIPETGVLASHAASPTVMNNVFFNLQTPIINEESRFFPLTFGVAPYGSNNPNIPSKPGEVVVGGSIYQYDEPASAANRFATGVEQVPNNVPNSNLDFNTNVADGVKLFVNAQASQYLPAAKSPLIDSAIDTLPERPGFASVKTAMGIAVSPLKAPALDLVGQLRVDDPDVASPAGQGQNVFKDRGAFDRADFAGPAAMLLDPIDNDALGVDADTSVSVVQLTDGVYPEFRIQLADGNEPTNPLKGVGIDDNTVTNSILAGKRLTGASVVLFEDGKLLREGIDYTFAYNATRDEIILTPLAGVWKNNRVYEISLNNKDRFVISAPSGDQVADGDSFSVTDSNGGVVVYEFDSGYRLQVPQGLTLQAPLAGGASGGIADGDRIIISDSVRTVTFEFDRNGNTLGGNIAIPFTLGSTQVDIAQAVATAISSSGLLVTPRILSGGRVFLGAETNVRVNTSLTALTQPATTLALKIPDLGPRPGGITDGQTFTISDGRRTITFEYDNNSSVSAGNTTINFAAASSVSDLARLTLDALAASPLTINPSIVSTDLVHIGLTNDGTVDVTNSRLVVLGVARTLADGQTFTISDGTTTKTFEFTRDANVTPGNTPISVSLSETQDEIGARVASIIGSAGVGLSPVHVGDGNIAVKGEARHAIDVTNAPVLGLFGSPGVQSNTRLQVFGSLILQVPTRGGVDITDNREFSITNTGRTVTFEFDNDFSGASRPGNVVVRYTSTSTANEIAQAVAAAISTAGLGINANVLSNGRIDLGILESNQVAAGNSGLTTSRGVVTDGEFFTINNGTTSITFEFDNVDLTNGSTAGRVPILFRNNSTPESVVDTMKAVIEGAGLGLTTTVLSGGVLQLNDTPRFIIDSTNSISLRRSGVPGGAKAVSFIQDRSFDSAQVKKSIIAAINAANDTPLEAKDRGGNTLFVENAVAISSEIDNYYLQGVSDLASNDLKPNQINNETSFTILMPGVELDYGDAPDPVSSTPGRYPSRKTDDGARHAISLNGVLLGAAIDADSDATPTPNADGDIGDDGVKFGSALNPNGLFNRFISTDVVVTLSSPGFVDGWIDFNSDGDWSDPGEQILTSVEFVAGQLTRTFQVTVPANAPVPATSTTSFARFRSSSVGGLLPTGLATDGEVEDYKVIIAPGTPPTAVDETYTINEDGSLTTVDAAGTITPSFRIDDGLGANDSDPEGGPFSIISVSVPPQVQLSGTNGLFTFTPDANFNGTLTLTYRVSDGVLVSNNIGTATFIVREVNDAPTAAADTIPSSEDTQLTLTAAQLLGNDSKGPDNESGQTLTITGVSAVSTQAGSVSLVAGQVIYTPPANFSGIDTFTYTITDNGTTGGLPAPLSSTATVTINVQDKNDVPTAGPDTLTVNQGVAGTISTTTLLQNDSPGPANESTTQLLQVVRVLPTSTAGGTLTLSGGNVIYTPPADFAGTDTFFYEVQDNGLSGTQPDPQKATGTVTVTVNNLPDAPRIATPLGTRTATEDSAAISIDLTTIFSDPDVVTSGDVLTYSVVGNSNASLVTPSVTGSTLTLPLLADANGQSLVRVQARDLGGLTVVSTLTLNVTPVNDPPRLVTAITDVVMSEDEAPRDVLLSPAFFFDPDLNNGDTLTLTLVSNSNALIVTPTVVGPGIRLSLLANQFGSSQITVRATDGTGLAVSDTFLLTVNPVNDAPTAVADNYTVPQGGTLIANDPRGTNAIATDNGVLANDSDIDSSTFTAVIVRQPAFGNVTFNSNGTFTYNHTGSTRATDSFTYRATDGAASSVETTVTITVGAALPPPHQNPINQFDVNSDGFVSAIDALLVINYLNVNNGGGPVAGLPSPPPYLDVSGNNNIEPFDALLVINRLNSGGNGEGEGEGESDVDALASASAFEYCVSRVSDNQSVSFASIPVLDGEVYGPFQAHELGLTEALDELENGTGELSIGWAAIDSSEVRHEAADEALDSLLADYPAQKRNDNR